MKARTVLYLEPEQMQTLKADAQRRGVTLGGLLRQLVRQHLDSARKPEEPPASTFMKIVGIGSGGQRSISERHDDYLARALRRERSR